MGMTQLELDSLTKIVDELCVTSNRLSGEVGQVRIILEKQGLPDLKAGYVVDKDYCEISHDKLETNFKCKYNKFIEAIDKKLKWTWIIGIGILGGYGTLLYFILEQLYNVKK